MKTNPTVGPTNGTKRSENEMTSDVTSITIRYADVARELRMPVYVVGGSAAAREPCRSVNVRFARPVLHEL